MKHGFGTLYLSNGEKFKGAYKLGKAHGIGTFYKQCGNEITGEWYNDVLDI